MSENLKPVFESNEKITSKIKLHIFRHGKKVIADGMPDETTPLSEIGRMEAKEKATIEDISQSVAFGSPRPRTLESAGFRMAGKSDLISGEESLEELKEKLDHEFIREGGPTSHPSKIGVDSRLDIHNSDTAYDDRFYDLTENTPFIEVLFNESDALAHELGDTTGDTYSRMASSLASIVLKYIDIAPRFNALVQDPDKNYTDTMERFMSTHGGVGESFLGKIIEITKGIEERNRFTEALDMKGFDYLEGFDVEILTTENEEPKVKIIFHKENATTFNFDEEIEIDTLKQIANYRY